MKKRILIYKLLILFSFPLSVVLKHIFNLIFYLLFLISGEKAFISDFGGLGIALITVSVIVFCLISIFQEYRGGH